MMTRRIALVTGLGVLVAAGTLAWWPAGSAAPPVRVGEPAPEITGGPWINSESLSLETLRGRVLFVEFWTCG